MSIDPNKKYVFSDPASFNHGKPVTQLHRFDVADGLMPWVGVCDGGTISFFDDDDRLREVDPVLVYGAVSCRGAVEHLASWRDLTSARRSMQQANVFGIHPHPSRFVGLYAVHASGKVRQIPLDATEDPEGGAA